VTRKILKEISKTLLTKSKSCAIIRMFQEQGQTLKEVKFSGSRSATAHRIRDRVSLTLLYRQWEKE